MTEENRQHAVRVNDADTRLLKSAQEEFETNVPLGYVARVGAKKIIEDSDDEVSIT